MLFSKKMSVFLTLLIPNLLFAHAYGGSGGLFTGFMHPFSGLDHFLAMFSIGLWGAQIGGRSIWTLPVTFPLVMVVGGVIGIVGIPLYGVEIGIALSIIVLGLCIAFSLKPAEWIVFILISVFAIYHGYAHGTELPKSANPADFAVGFVIATGLIHIIGIGVGLVSEKLYSGKVTKVLGGFIVIGGIYFFINAV